jgi:hypothetical protein
VGSEQVAFLDVEQEGMLHQFDQGFGGLHALEGDGGCAAVAQKIDPPQRAGACRRKDGFASKEAGLGW